MKKLIISMITAILCTSTISTVVSANSGPVFWNGDPASEMMAIDVKSPIQVKRENLIFDFSNSENFSNTGRGKVTAIYEMANPTNELQSVQVAFPFVGRIDYFNRDDIVIMANEKVVAYDIYFGEVVNKYGESSKSESFDFEKVVSSISDYPYKAKNFSENEVGRLYSIDVKPTPGERINILVDFHFNSEKTKVFTKGFNSYGYDDKRTEISALCYEPMTLEIFVLGKDIDFKINGFTDGELKQKTELFTYQTSVKEVRVKPYLMEFMNSHTPKEFREVISDTQLYNLYASAFDKSFIQYMGYSSEFDLLEKVNYDRIFTLVYTVDFPANTEKEISVSYQATGSMDKRETITPLYTFDYLLNPAKNWSDFKNLTIKIITPKQAPHIVESNLELEKEANHVYTAAFAELPEADFSFTLYANEKITVIDNLKGNLPHKVGYVFLLMLGLGVLLIIVLRKRK